MPSQGHDIEDGILLQDHLKEVIFMMIVTKGIKEVVQVHHKEVFRLVYDRNHYFSLGPIPKPKPKLVDTFGRYRN